MAIEPDPHTLLIDARQPWGGKLIPTTFYGAGILLVALALVDRRLKQVDPEVVRRRKSLRHHHRRIEGAAGMPHGQAVKQIADALRAIVAEVPDADRTEVEAITLPNDGLRFRQPILRDHAIALRRGDRQFCIFSGSPVPVVIRKSYIL